MRTGLLKYPKISRRGFTLAELLIVVLIVGIVAGIAIPRFSAGLGQRQATALARQMVNDIETVRQVARASSAPKSLVITSASKTYTLNGVEHPDRNNIAYVVSLADVASTARFGTINFGGDPVLIFNGFGYPDSGGSVQIIVGTVTKTVTVDAQTGSSTIQ
ncbi:MAG: putative fimbrial protein [Planctomycetaceae bacterium]|nr:putative fimbrial protein [Planctomycetaceae bacterium]